MYLSTRHISRILVLFACIFFSNPIYSVNRVWTNVLGNDLWNEPTNWIPIGVPQPRDSVSTGYVDDLVIPFNYTASIKYFKHLGDLTIFNGGELIITDGHFNCNGDVLNQGTIHINNSPTYGIKHSSQQLNSRPITNEGAIYISNSASAGLWIRFDQTFTNAEGALVEITNSGEAGIELEGTFSNSGLLRAQGSINDIGILMEDEASSFTNLKCASIKLQDQITISNGLFSNFGFLRQDYIGMNSMGSPFLEDYFINYGVLEDLQGSFLESEVVNLGVWIKLYEDIIMEGESTSIFLNAYPSDVSISDVYLEKELITLAGTYDYTTNIWVPNSNAVGMSSFFVEVTQSSSMISCIDTVRFNLIAVAEGVNYWKGGTGSWQFGINWNYGTVPTSVERVAIYNVTDEVTIPINYQAFAKDILLNGKLTVAPLSALTIDNPSQDEALNISGGNLVNNGIIKLEHTKTGAYVKGGYVENNGEIKCSDLSFCMDLISVEGVKSELINTIN